METPEGNCHLVGLLALSDRYMPDRFTGDAVVLYSSTQSALTPAGEASVSLSAMNSLMRTPCADAAAKPPARASAAREIRIFFAMVTRSSPRDSLHQYAGPRLLDAVRAQPENIGSRRQRRRVEETLVTARL